MAENVRPNDDMAAGSECESSYEADTRPAPRPDAPEVEPRRTNDARLFLIESGSEKSCAAKSRLPGRLPTLLPSDAAKGDAVVLDASDLRSCVSECRGTRSCCCCRLDESSDLPRTEDGSRNEAAGAAAANTLKFRPMLLEWVNGACLPIVPNTDDDRADDGREAGGNMEDSNENAGADVDLASTLKPTTRLLPFDDANGRSKGDGAIAEVGIEPDDSTGFDDCRVIGGGCGGGENP